MAELEKKYSDFQKNECEEELKESQVLDPKLCPTCTPNPNFKLSDDWWELEEGYLNEAVCEYHIRVYEGSIKVEIDNLRGQGLFEPSDNQNQEVAVSSFHEARLDLEDAFLKLTKGVVS